MYNYEEIFMQYTNALELHKKVIEKKRKQLNQARRKADYAEVKRLNSLLNLLYQEKCELEESTNGLKKYLN